MRELKNSHKFIIFSETFKFIKNIVVPFVIFFILIVSIGFKVSGKYGGNYTVISVVIIAVLLVIILATVRWKKNGYYLDDDVLSIKHGVFMTHERMVPFSQVQSADISSSVIQRLFNVRKLEIDTARGEDRIEISILLSKEEALRVKSIIFKENRNSANVEIMEGANIKKINCSVKDLFMMSLMSSGILAGFFMIINAYFKIQDIASKEVMRKVQVFSEDAIKGINTTSMIKYRVTLIFIMLLILWMISVIATIIKYYKFTVIRNEDNIKLSYGLFDKKEVTIPVKQIQSLTLVEGVIKKSLGYFSLKVDTAGYGEVGEGGGSTVICPSGKREVINKFFQDILPEMNITYDLIKSPREALMGFLVFRLLIECVVMSLVAIYVPYGYYIFILVPILAIWHYISFIDNGLYSNKDFVILRYRNLSRKTVIIKKDCIKSIQKEQNTLQKKKAIAKYRVIIPGDGFGKLYSVGYMDENYVEDI
ncbi:PH domain-containing protein [Clostridium bowmanii]|uniref:PH domain-containing protein n=1 Tax=Clostridium bowmanii TaxID=132925 RepID=UPI001C0C2A85|nr:PH domain-containing protein [Clostridium bowmanii]MBU3189970.1 PH domain-containing protein [Clostridium bowmanii]MCA1074596.1 PH domain-containing protein [Clostridium bowmanii]